MAQREIQRVVEHAIDDLPEAFRIVFITRVIEGMNVEETAEILGLKPETVKTRLHPRPHHAARQCRKENRPCGHGGVSVCRQALRAPD
jgi:DNA-directed RNA polymerase specialized sigma24 family protein